MRGSIRIAAATAVALPLLIGAASGATSAYRDQVLADHPSAYWRLGETSGTVAADETGAAPGTLVNGVLLGQTGALLGDPDTAASFDGVDDYVTVPDRPALAVTAGVTVEAWVKRSRSAAYQVVVGKPGNGQSKYESYSLWLDTANDPVAYFGNGTSYARVASPSPLDTGWHYVAATYDNATARLYVDGKLTASGSSSVQLTPNTLPLSIGHAYGGAYFFGGRLDEIAVYPQALSQARISAHYGAATVADTTAPVVTLTTPGDGTATDSRTPTFTGAAGNAAGDSATVTVKVYAGTSASGAPVQTLSGTRAADSTYSTTAAPALPDGTYTAQATQADAAGNTGTSTANTFTLDATAPTPTLQAPADGSSTPSATPTFSGVAGTLTGDSTNITIKLYSGTTNTGTPVQTLQTTRQPGGAYTVDAAPLSSGSYTAQAEQNDAAGNTGRSTTTTFTVNAADTTAPVVTLTTPADGTATDEVPLVFTGTAGTLPGDSPSLVVNLYSGTSATGPPVETLFAAVAADGTYSTQSSTISADGSYSARAEQADDAGNLGRSGVNTFRVDDTAPVISLVAPANGSSSNVTVPLFTGSAGTAPGDSTTVAVKLYSGQTAVGDPLQTLVTDRQAGGAYSVAAMAELGAGTYTARAEQHDSAGNLGTTSANTFTITTAAPYRSRILADSPVSFWRLNETSGTVAADETGRNPGRYVNGPLLGQDGPLTSEPDKSASFDGVNDYVTVPDSASLDLATAVSVEVWVRRTKSATFQVIAGKPGNGQSKFENYALWFDTTNKAVAYFGNGAAFARVDSAAPLDGNWHYLVATYDNANAKMYVDGVLKSTVASTVHLTPNANPFNMGRENSNQYYFGGALDEIAVYPTILSAAQVQAHFTAASGAADRTAPAVTLTTPEQASATTDTTPFLAGSAGYASGDSTAITLQIYAGSSGVGTPVRTLMATREPANTFSVEATPALPAGTYTAQAQQVDAAGNIGLSLTSTFSVGPTQATTDPVMVGAGDIAYCGGQGDEATAALLTQFPGAVVYNLGDNAYEVGSPSDYSNCYDPSWGQARARTRPVLGGHDYGDASNPGATGYLNYFSAQLAPYGASASDPKRGWYSYDIGTWHVVVLNSVWSLVGLPDAGSAQDLWLRADLAAHPNLCTLALWHNPRFSSGLNGSDYSFKPFWDALYQYNADVILNGHDHDYERFAPQTPAGTYDPQRGIRAFVVGTGGRSHYQFPGTFVANSEVRNDNTFGVLKLRLHPGSYDWQFVPEAGKAFTDSGSGVCH